jgi:hypothetical protein
VHDSNEWGIEVMPEAALPSEDRAATAAAGGGSSGSAGAGGGGGGGAGSELVRPPPELPEGVAYALPAATGVTAEVLAVEGVGKVEAGMSDLLAQLSALNSSSKAG